MQLLAGAAMELRDKAKLTVSYWSETKSPLTVQIRYSAALLIFAE